MAVGSMLGGLGAKAVSAVANPNVRAAGYFAMGVNSELKRSDRSMGAAVAKTAVTSAFYASNPFLAMGVQLAPAAVQGARAAHQFRRTKAEELSQIRQYSQSVGGGYIDTNQALTMRQAAVQQIQGNKLNARSALGGEARIFSNRRFTG